jgi:hypothetical protein
MVVGLSPDEKSARAAAGSAAVGLVVAGALRPLGTRRSRASSPDMVPYAKALIAIVGLLLLPCSRAPSTASSTPRSAPAAAQVRRPAGQPRRVLRLLPLQPHRPHALRVRRRPDLALPRPRAHQPPDLHHGHDLHPRHRLAGSGRQVLLPRCPRRRDLPLRLRPALRRHRLDQPRRDRRPFHPGPGRERSRPQPHRHRRPRHLASSGSASRSPPSPCTSTPPMSTRAHASVSAFLAFVPKAAGFLAILMLCGVAGWSHGTTGDACPSRSTPCSGSSPSRRCSPAMSSPSSRPPSSASSPTPPSPTRATCSSASSPGRAGAGAFWDNGLAAVLFYLLCYGVMNVGAFAVLASSSAHRRRPLRRDRRHRRPPRPAPRPPPPRGRHAPLRPEPAGPAPAAGLLRQAGPLHQRHRRRRDPPRRHPGPQLRDRRRSTTSASSPPPTSTPAMKSAPPMSPTPPSPQGPSPRCSPPAA